MQVHRKRVELINSGQTIKNLLIEKDIKPLDIMTCESFLNAVKFLTLIGGSTNGVIHLLAIVKTAKVNLLLDDFKEFEHFTSIN